MSKVHQPSSKTFEDFSDALDTQRVEYLDKFRSRSDELIHRMSDHADNLRSRLELAWDNKSTELTQRIRDMYERVKNDMGTTEVMTYNYLEESHRIALHAMHRRATLLIQVVGGNEVSTKRELAGLSGALNLFENTDVDQYLSGSGINESLLQSAQENFGQTQILTRLRDGQPLLPEQVETMVSQVGLVLNEQLNPEAEFQVFALLSAMPPEQVELILSRVPEQPEKEQFIVTMASLNVITVVQAKRMLPEVSPTLLFFETPEFRAMQLAIHQVGEQHVEQYTRRRQFGHTNSLNKLGSIQGLSGAILSSAGALTILANIIMNPKNPFNPGTLFGVGELALGRELSKPGTVRRLYERLTHDRAEEATEEQSVIIVEAQNDMRFHRLYAEMYRDHSVAVWSAFRAELNNPERAGEIKLNEALLTEHGFDVNQFKADHPEVNMTAAINKFTEWAHLFNKTEDGLACKTSVDQNAFINATLEVPEPKTT